MSTMPSLGNTLKPPEPIGSRDEIHNALHWLARMARSFHASTSADDSVPLLFDPDRLRFLTPEIAPGTALTLSLPDLVLQFEENGALSPHAMDVDEKSSTEIEAWLLCELLHRGFDRERFSKSLPYPQDRLLTGDERKYASSEHIEELRKLTDALESAASILLSLKDAHGGGLQASEAQQRNLVCWPERLEIGFTSASQDGAVDLDVGYMLGDPNEGDAPVFFVRPVLTPLRPIASSALPADDLSQAGLHETLDGMVAKMRASVAH